MNLRKSRFKIPIYNFDLTVVVCDDANKAVQEITKQTSEDHFDGVFFYNKNKHDLYIVLEKGVTHGVIAHEALHDTYHILNYVGVTLNEESEESFTYLLGFIVDKLYLSTTNNKVVLFP